MKFETGSFWCMVKSWFNMVCTGTFLMNSRTLETAVFNVFSPPFAADEKKRGVGGSLPHLSFLKSKW